MSSAIHVSTKASDSELLPGAWLVVALLFFVGTLNYLDRSTITTMRESVVAAIPMNNAEFGLLTSVFLWVYGILSPFAGFMADKFSKSKVIIVSLIVWSAVTLLTGFSKTFGELLATRALMGISEACYIPAALALIMDYHRGSTRSLANGINIIGMMVGSSLGFVGGWIAEKYRWDMAFHIFGAIGIVYSVILIFFLHDVPEKTIRETEVKVNFMDALRYLFSKISFILMLVFWGLLGVAGWVIMGWLPTYYQMHFKLSQAIAGLYATGYFYPAAIVGLIAGGFLADRWNKINLRGRILVPVLGLCIAAPGIFIASGTNVLPLAILFFIIYMFTRMFSDANMMPILCLVADSRYRATGYGILNLSATVAGGIGLYAGGVLRDFHISLGYTFKGMSLLLILCAVLLYLVKPDQKIVKAEANER